MVIDIFDETGEIPEELLNIMKVCAEEAARTESLSPQASVDILIVDSCEIKEINKARRGIDSPTDVLSFPMNNFSPGDLPSSGQVFLGDIVICKEKVFEQAWEYGHEPSREIGFLTAHGMLHLMGYDHINADDEKEMFQKQEAILSDMGLAR